MSSYFDISIEVSQQYDFDKGSLAQIELNPWVKNQWPLVYFIQNIDKRLAYVGESTNAFGRIKNHLANSERRKLNKISIIGSDKFNKSATLDIESKLIQYISAEGTYELQNGNFGLINHNYYQQDLYKGLFKEIWKKLIEKKIVSKSLKEIENSEIFKYSPYKSLNEDQYASVMAILSSLTQCNTSKIFVKGGAGTGKTILATYLMKLLSSKLDNVDSEELNEDELTEIKYIKAFQSIYPAAKIGLVVAMTSLRESLKTVFGKTPGLKASMVISPSETFKLKQKFDLLIIDEAHRLRQYRNIGWLGTFRKNNRKLGLDDTGNELDWIIANSKNQIFFYDAAQSVKPSDINESNFEILINNPKTVKLALHSQMRVQGGDDYINFVDELLHVNRPIKKPYAPKNYELVFFDSLTDMYKELEKRELKFGLARLVAGYSWPWLSTDDKEAIDIEIDGLKFQWNTTNKDWVNSPNAFKEVGCIHTTQGYDLNYTGVIFGKEIDFDPVSKQILVNDKLYFDKYGKNGITSNADLKSFVVNIYKTILYRGVRGSFIYAFNKNMKEYLKQHIVAFKKEVPFRVLHLDDVIPFVNAVPLLNITPAAGVFSDFQIVSDFEWIELPINIAAKEGYFVCKIIGESMNKRIPNGSYCLFSRDDGGTRNGKIILVELYDRQDTESGSRYTVKEYRSVKKVDEDGWKHESIRLRPLSDDSGFDEIVLRDEGLENLKVLGIFERVLES